MKKKNKDEFKNNSLKDNFKMYFKLFIKYIYIIFLIFFVSFLSKYFKYINLKENIEINIYSELKNEIENINTTEDREKIINILKNYKKKGKKENLDIKDEYNKIIIKYGLDESFLESENIYKEEYIKELLFIYLVILILYIILIYIIYKKEKNLLENINDIHFLLRYNKNKEENEFINHKIYFNKLNYYENSISNEKSKIYKEIVKLKKIKEKEEQNRKSIENFISDISHQIRLPIANLKLEIFDLKEQNKNTLNIEKNIDKISFLIEELLKMARLDSKSIIFKKEKIKYSEIIENVINRFKYILDLKNIDIKWEKKENTNILVDKKWTEEAVSNILKNAIEHSRENSEIYIDFVESGLYQKIIIKDKGEGLDKSEIKNIFKRFFKGKGSNAKSIGIGLNISKQIIEQQGGYISVYSKKDEGTSFKINLLKR